MIFWLGSLLLLQLARVVFLVRSAAAFEGVSFSDLARSFLYGLRFDLSALAYLYLAVLVVEFVLNLLRSKYAITLSRVFKVFGVIFFFVVSLIDVEYFVIAQKRLDASILLLSGDIADQSKQFLIHYKYIVIASFVAIFIFWHLSGRNQDKLVLGKFPLGRFFKRLVLVPGAVLIARGGFQEKPIKISSATDLGQARLVTLSMSTPFVVLHTLKAKNKLEVFSDYSEVEAKKILLEANSNNSTSTLLASNPTDNVVVLILESFSKEYAAFTPFLEGLKRKSINFENHFANGTTSIEAIPSLLGGLPTFLGVPFITSPYVNTDFKTLPRIDTRGSHDYVFLHGARRGSMYFDSFTKYLGFEYYFGKEDYDGDASAFYDWGVHDHAFLEYSGRKLQNWKKPFVATIFTLSSHQPYEIPAQFSTTLAHAPTPFTRSLRYADYSLQLFFEKFSNEEWFKRTLFIITGDHTSHCQSKDFCSQSGSHRVPLLIYHGGRDLGGVKVSNFSQHVDVPATIADYLNLKSTDLLPFGRSLLRGASGRALLNSSSEYSLLESGGLFKLSASSFTRCEMGDIAEASCKGTTFEQYPEASKYLRALRSYYSQGLDKRVFK